MLIIGTPDNCFTEAMKWLKAPDIATLHNQARGAHEPGTGTWFLASDTFQEFKMENHSFLWLHGIPGCGKSVLSSTIIEELKAISQAGNASVGFFYFSFTAENFQGIHGLVRSLIFQLASRSPVSREALTNLHRRYKEVGQPMLGSLMDTLKAILQDRQCTYVVIDALDECNDYKELLQVLGLIKGWEIPTVHFLFTSRNILQLREGIKLLLPAELSIPRQSVDADIRMFVRSQLENDEQLKRWSPDMKTEIETALMEGSDGM
jgi:hypothetical protein